MTESVKFTREADIACVVLNRPQAFNAFDRDLVEGFAGHLLTLAVDPEVRGVVISGEGKAFCAGGDLRYIQEHPQGAAASLHELAGLFHQAVLEIRRMPKPVIAAVNGVADGGGSFTLPRLVGLARALEIVAFDRPIAAEQAMAWGLATRIVPDAEVLQEAMSLAHQLAGISLNSFSWAKRLLTDSFNSAFEAHLERERRGLVSCATHADGQEGLQAFVDKRPPAFRR